MKRALLIAFAFLLVAAPMAQAAACPKPERLSFTRKPGAASGTLLWHPVKRGVRYRVLRGRDVIGQTKRSYMRVRVSVNRSYTFQVRPVGKRGKPMRCRARLRHRVAYKMPSAPPNFAVTGASGAAAHLAWGRARRGEAPVAGYRVLRDGATFKQTPGQAIDVPIANDRTYRFTVLAVDRHGQLSPASPEVTIESGHQPPPAPATVIASDVSESELTLSWSPSQPARGAIAGYRVFRDGKPLRQVRGLSTRVTNLAAASRHEFTVAAVDSAGWISARSAPASVSTTPPVPSTGRAHAFLLASTDRSFADFRAHYRKIGTVYPTFFDCTVGAELTGANNAQIVSWAQQRAVKVLPRFNCQRTATLHRILNEPALREQWLDGIVTRVVDNGYDGANLDFEAGLASDRSAYTSFFTELASRLHARGKLLSVAVNAKTADVQNHPRSTFFDYAALAQQVDTIFVMAWGIHWQTSAPGAQDDMRWFRRVVDYTSTIGQPGRFVIAFQLYGMDWPNGGGPKNPSVAYEYDKIQELIARVGATPVRDPLTNAWYFGYIDSAGVPHDVWYTDAATQADRMQLARERGFGVGFWRLGNEDQRLWDQPQLDFGGG